MSNRLTWAALVLSAYCLVLNHASSPAQMSSTTMTLTQEGVVVGGGRVGSGNPMSIITALGDAIGGLASNGIYTLRAGYPAQRHAPAAGSKLIAVEGTVSEPVSSVIVNSVAAVVTGTSFRADGVLLREGPNTITVTATDLAGNSATRSITVFLDTIPPARPTVAATPAVTTGSSVSLSGTKTPGTSVWVNGVEVVPLSDATSWNASVALVEGDNVLVIVTKDAAGNVSTSVTVNVIVDNLPPVVTCAPVAKTNFNPLIVQGSVDDSLTTVTVNGIAASRTARAFEVSVPLTLGANTLSLIARSPNGYTTSWTYAVTLGTIPTIQAVQPPDAAKVYAGASTAIQVSASDAESDPIEYQVLLDSVPLGTWSSSATQPWTPGLGQLGLHTVTAAVRDAFGGSRTQDVEVFVVRPPIEHP